MENIIWIQNYQSPCGELILGSLDGKLCLCDWMDENRRALIDRRLQKVLHARYETGESEVIVRQLPSWMNILPEKERSSTSRCYLPVLIFRKQSGMRY